MSERGPVESRHHGEFARGALELVEAGRMGALLERALRVLVGRTGAREAYVEVMNDHGGMESSYVLAEGCSADRVQEIQALVSRGIIGEAMATGRRVETANAQLDPLLLRAREGE